MTDLNQLPVSLRVLESIEADAWADLFRAAPVSFRERAGLGYSPLGGALTARMKVFDHVQMNRVFCLGVIEPASPYALDEILASYKRAGIQHLQIHLAPSARPQEIASWLVSRGFSISHTTSKFYRETEGLQDPSCDTPQAAPIRIERIAPEHAMDFGRLTIAAFGLPPILAEWLAGAVGRPSWRHYLALRGETPLGAAALFARDGRGWLGLAATLPGQRGQGAQKALILRRVKDAAAMGCRWLVSETDAEEGDRENPAHRNLLRAGFSLAYKRPNYTR